MAIKLFQNSRFLILSANLFRSWIEREKILERIIRIKTKRVTRYDEFEESVIYGDGKQ